MDNSLIPGISDIQLQEFTDQVKLDPEEVKKRYDKAIADLTPDNEVEIILGDEVKEENCRSRSFTITFFKILTWEGYAKFCGPISDPSGVIKVTIKVLGKVIASRTFKFSKDNLYTCMKRDLALVKYDLCIGFRTSKWCFGIWGETCYWKPFRFHCGKFDESLFCFE